MARTAWKLEPPPQPVDHSLGLPRPLAGPDGRDFLTGGIEIVQLAGDSSEMIMKPLVYEDRNDIGPAASWRRDSDGNQYKCWHTTVIYQHIEDHPHVVRFIRPDSWTFSPVVANPGGPHLREFIEANREEMYEEQTNQNRTTASGRVKASRKSLVYQWSLHLASALESIHSYSFEPPAPKIAIIFGDLTIDSCWLSSSGLSLSVLGFLNSAFRTRSSREYVGGILISSPFQPLHGIRGDECKPTRQTDIFLWGCVVYELMTGYWPGDGQGLPEQEISTSIPRREWPRLETEYLGDVVRRCCTRRNKECEGALGHSPPECTTSRSSH